MQRFLRVIRHVVGVTGIAFTDEEMVSDPHEIAFLRRERLENGVNGVHRPPISGMKNGIERAVPLAEVPPSDHRLASAFICQLDPMVEEPNVRCGANNNVLTVLNTLLKKAVEWGVMPDLPCVIKLLKTSSASVDFYTFDEYDRLAKAAQSVDALGWVAVLLGGDAGLRAGEMRALLWTDVDLDRGMLRVERNDWRGQVSTTKGNRLRYVPMTSRLREALRAHRHLRGPLVLCKAGGEPLTESALKEAIFRAARRANLRCTVPHMLRHTFCSHLAMRGAPPRAIQELAGHRDIATTQRYMHLSPAAIVDAIRLLEQPARGDIVETAVQPVVNACR